MVKSDSAIFFKRYFSGLNIGLFFLLLFFLSKAGEAQTVTPAEKKQNDSEVNRSESSRPESINVNRSPRVLYFLGYAAEKAGDLPKALVYYEAAIQKKPDANTVARSARVYLKLGRVDDAERAAKQSIQISNTLELPFFILADIAQSRKDLELVLTYYNEILRINFDNTEAHLYLATYFVNLQKWPKASRHYFHILDVASRKEISQNTLLYTYYALGTNFQKEGNNAIAVRYLERAFHLNPGSMRIALQLADLYYQSNDYRSALGKYELVFSYYSGNYNIATRIAELHFLLDEDYLVKKYLEKAKYYKFKGGKNLAQSNWVDYTPDMIRGFELYYQGKWQDARNIFLKVLKGNYRNVAVHYALTHIFRKLQDKPRLQHALFTTALLMAQGKHIYVAERFYGELIRMDEKNPKYLYYLARLLERKQENYRAILLIKKLQSLVPDNIQYPMHLAYLYILTDQQEKALILLDKIITNQPKNAHAYFLKGFLWYRYRNYKEASRNFQEATALKPSAVYFYHLAAAQEREKKLKEAMISARRAIELDPRDSRSYNFLGYLYADYNQNLDEAIELIYTALEQDPENAAYQDSLGWAFFRKGDLDKAHHHINLSIKYFQLQEQQDPVAYDHLGDVLLKQGRLDEAVRAWKKGLALYQKNTIAEDRLEMIDKLQKKIENYGK